MGSDDAARHGDTTSQGASVVEMHESGMSWKDIADELGTNVEGAMAAYREEAYDHWDTGWEADAKYGTGNFETGSIEVWGNGDATLQIEEISDCIPLATVVDNDESHILASARLTAEQARDLAVTLDECADILEDKQ